MTVLGQMPVEKLGVTLMHEHILLDASSWWKRPCCGVRDRARRAADRRRHARRAAHEPVPQSRQLPAPRRRRRDRGADALRRAWRADGRRPDQSRHRPRSARAPTDQPSDRAEHRHGCGLLSRTVASGLCPAACRSRRSPLHRARLRRRSRTTCPSLPPASSARSASARTSPPRRRRCCAAPRGLRGSRAFPCRSISPGWERHGHRVLDVIEAEGARPSPHGSLSHESEPRTTSPISGASPTAAPFSNTT